MKMNKEWGIEKILIASAISTSNTDAGNVFRYDTENNQYIYNLATSSLWVGSWQLKVILDDGKYYTVVISLQ